MQNSNQSITSKNKLKQKNQWYKKWWGILLIIFVFLPIGFVVFAIVFAIASYDGVDENRAQNTYLSQDEISDQTAEDEAAAAEITKLLIEGYVPRYCETHQGKNIPLPYQDGEDWKYNIQSPTTNVTEADCRNVITYLVENINSSAENLERISNAKISVGMNRHELLMSWGVPNDVNSTLTAAGSNDQYVYGNPIYGASYVYLDNDIITAIQN